MNIMLRRKFLRKFARYGSVVGSVSLLQACGAGGLGDILGGGNNTPDPDPTPSPAPLPAEVPEPIVITIGRSDRLPRHQELRQIGLFYSKRAANDYETQYSTKAYLAASTLAGGLGGLVIDTADPNHTPYVKTITEVDETYHLNVTCAHAVNAEHHIAGVDIWIDGDITPTASFVTPAADIAAGLTEFNYVIPVPKTTLDGAQFVVLVSHCNLHGGHINLNDGETVDA